MLDFNAMVRASETWFDTFLYFKFSAQLKLWLNADKAIIPRHYLNRKNNDTILPSPVMLSNTSKHHLPSSSFRKMNARYSGNTELDKYDLLHKPMNHVPIFPSFQVKSSQGFHMSE